MMCVHDGNVVYNDRPKNKLSVWRREINLHQTIRVTPLRANQMLLDDRKRMKKIIFTHTPRLLDLMGSRYLFKDFEKYKVPHLKPPQIAEA